MSPIKKLIEKIVPERKITQYKPPEPVAPEDMNSDSDDSVLSFHGDGVCTMFAKLPYRRPFLPPEKTPLPKSVPNTPKKTKVEKVEVNKTVFYP